MTKRILFVDDEPMLLRALEAMLRKQRHRWAMAFVDSGAGAIAALNDGPFDVVVSDMRMPEMDGATLLGIVRERNPQTVCILLTGQADESHLARAHELCGFVLSKPCAASALVATIEQATESAQSATT